MDRDRALRPGPAWTAAGCLDGMGGTFSGASRGPALRLSRDRGCSAARRSRISTNPSRLIETAAESRLLRARNWA